MSAKSEVRHLNPSSGPNQIFIAPLCPPSTKWVTRSLKTRRKSSKRGEIAGGSDNVQPVALRHVTLNEDYNREHHLTDNGNTDTHHQQQQQANGYDNDAFDMEGNNHHQLTVSSSDGAPPPDYSSINGQPMDGVDHLNVSFGSGSRPLESEK
ncbi:hypothetical protein PoB_004479200, partial [Plakobranchus ocellatus]